jgi:hypothetical protein
MVVAGALLSIDAGQAGAWSGLGAIAVGAAALAWALDNTLIRPLAEQNPLSVVAAKGALGAALTGSLALARHEQIGAGRLDDRDEIDRDHEHRASHAEGADERAILVEGALERGHGACGLLQAGRGRQVHGGRIGGVQANETCHDTVQRLRRRGQKVPPTEPRPSAETPTGVIAACWKSSFMDNS